MKQKLVYLLILNWNGWKDTIECVESCTRLTYSNFRILIIDNGSSDGSERILRERFPGIAIHQTGSNLGFAGGNNAGIRVALAHGADFIWLLNNDTIVAPEALTELIKVAQSNARTGIVGSKIYFHDRPDVLWFAGGWIRPVNATCGHRGQLEKDEGQYDEIEETGYVTGCSLLIPATVVNATGLMDERFFLLYEETDWNVRIQRRGYAIVYAPGSKVWHKVSVSLGSESPLYFYYLFRNSMLFTVRHNPVFLATALLKRLKEIAYFLRHKRFAHASAGLSGLRDFMILRFGQRK